MVYVTLWAEKWTLPSEASFQRKKESPASLFSFIYLHTKFGKFTLNTNELWDGWKSRNRKKLKELGNLSLEKWKGFPTICVSAATGDCTPIFYRTQGELARNTGSVKRKPPDIMGCTWNSHRCLHTQNFWPRSQSCVRGIVKDSSCCQGGCPKRLLKPLPALLHDARSF